MLSILNLNQFQNLSILICHLFIGGQFRMTNVIFEPNSFDFRLINQIESICPMEIIWTFIDVTESSTPTLNNDLAKDQILQIIFMDFDHVSQRTKISEQFPAYYRLFIFNTFGDKELSLPSIPINISFNPSTNSLVLFYSLQKDTFNTFLIDDKFRILTKINHENTFSMDSNSKDIFNTIFGERERNRILGVYYPISACEQSKERTHVENLYKRYVANFYFLRMNMTFIEKGRPTCGSYRPRVRGLRMTFRPIQKRIYNELSEVIGDNM